MVDACWAADGACLLSVGIDQTARITTQNLTVVRTDVERGLILVKGAVPGHEGTFVEIRDAVKKALPENAPKSGSFKAPEKLTAGGEG